MSNKYLNVLLVSLAFVAIFSSNGVAESDSGILDKIDELEKKNQLLEKRLDNAVIAFESGTCPEGWQVYTAASGRTIIGAGKGEGLTVRQLHERAGTESNQLTVSEMPEHSHNIEGMTHYSYSMTNYPRVHTNLYTKNNEFQSKGKTLPTGREKPLNNLPPYLVLTFCKK